MKWLWLLLCAAATNRIGIFAVFGAFLLGAVLSGEHDFRAAVNRRGKSLLRRRGALSHLLWPLLRAVKGA